MTEAMTDDAQHANVVREYAARVREQGSLAAIKAEREGGDWRRWATQLGELVRTMPLAYPPIVLGADGDSEFVQLFGIRTVDRQAMLTRLEEVLAYADAVPAALFRAGKQAFEQSNDLADKLAADATADTAMAGDDHG